MASTNAILKDIQNKKLKPIYLLHGEEPFYIDQIADTIAETVLPEEQRSFNQTVLYGRDVTVEDIATSAKRYPMMADYQVIIVKEAQDLVRQIEQLENYAANPQPTTVLVLKWMNKKPDARKKVFKLIKKTGVVYESKKLYDNQVMPWILDRSQQKGLGMEPNAAMMLAEFLGADLNKIENELSKLLLIVGENGTITPQIIEENIGVSKDHNNFELRKALGQRNAVKVFKIVNYFAQNQKDHPLVVTLGQLYSLFNTLFKYHTLRDRNPKSVASALRINPYFIGEYSSAARLYGMKSCSAAIRHLKDADLKSKGLGGGQMPHSDVLKELCSKILAS